ncbi:hypothetical protein DUI87_01543 [Hirundo rustica rustica]|uniref:Uncharacterized protein n=1 Tax=Hirundo rustica rustica TaxID=333673 RepID=A0A3M0L6F2_HIRRU|nr:hypothetical protein DUI87_01543 [Hirundo rustica rustica]
MDQRWLAAWSPRVAEKSGPGNSTICWSTQEFGVFFAVLLDFGHLGSNGPTYKGISGFAAVCAARGDPVGLFACSKGCHLYHGRSVMKSRKANKKRPCHELQPGSSEQGLHIPYNKPHLLKPNFRDLSSTFIYTVLESSAAGGSNFYNWRTTWKTPDPAFQAVRDFPMDVVNKNGGDVGEEEAKKPYKYDCLYSENEKPVGEIELKKQGIALGILAQNLIPYQRAVAYLSKQLDTAAKGWPGYLRAVAAVAINIQEACKFTLGQKMTVLISHTVSAVLEAKGGHWLSLQRFPKYQAILVEQDDAEIVVTNIVNPASFLSGSMGEPVICDCLETIEATYSRHPDLKDTPLEDADTWFTDGSSYVVSGRRHAGYAVTTSKEVIESGPLPTNTSAQKAEIIALIRALELAKGKEINIYTDSRLQLTEGLHLKDDNWNFVSVDNSEQGTWPRVKGKLIIVGDCKHTPKEIEILPGTFDNNPGKFVLWLRCTHPPTFLPKGQTVAQIIPTWEHLEEDNIPTACPMHNITEVKPQVGCELQVGDEAINITGLLHMDMDVTVIPAKHWPSRWALENVAGHVQGIGGMQLAKQSKSVVQIKGPKGQLASLRPFVLDYREPLLGRDLMAQWGVTIDIPDPPQDFWAAVTEERPTHKLNWKTDAPVWVEQWPLSKQKLKALEELVEEQLAKGHIVETTSPWNSPVFVIRKPGKDKWRLLQDLRQINNVIEDMGSLQPGMPTPTMLPQNWKLAVIDIKDCFFHIPLHPDDAPRFAFSVPTVNREAPRKRYHWRVLPQGMKVSPIICQWYVASLLSPVRVAAEKAIIHHYVDDVLVCAPTDDVLSHALDLTINALVVAGFELQEDKVQRMPPWRYLGLEIGKRTIVPQKLEIKAKIQTLADVHQLCGALNWVRPWLGLTTEDLAPLFNLLKGGEELSSPRELTPEAKEALEKVQHLMSTRQAHRCDPDLPFKFIIMGKLPHLHGVIFQWRNNIKKDQGREDPLLIIEWVFLSHQRSKRMTRPQELVAELIRKARVRIRELAGCDFECIHIPIGLRSGQITKAMLEHLLQENEALQFALDSFTGQISIHRPAHKIFNQDVKFTLNLKDVRSRKPLEALTVFTDASGKSHKSVMTWKDPQTQQWEADVAEVEGSPQGSIEVMQVLRVFNGDALPPYDIRCLARVLFRPVKYEIFEYKWTQLAGRVAAQNAALGQQDPSRVIGTDELLGTGNFADLSRQVALDPLVLDQCQRTGMAALIQTIEMAAPKESFVTVVQGTGEPFLQFAERLNASMEKQVEDLNARMLLLKHLARTNCNADCRKIIEALLGNPSVSQMAEACAKLGKQEAECEGEMHSGTKFSPGPGADGGLLGQLRASTCGSAGLDVCTAATVIIDSCGEHKVPLDAFGPVDHLSFAQPQAIAHGKINRNFLQPKISQEPVQGPTIFTDGSGRTGKAIVTWRDGSEWQILEGHEDGSAQLVELRAAVMAFQRFSQHPFNLVTDSAYVADIAQQLGHSVLKEFSNAALFHLLKTLWCAIQARVHPYYILHVRSHTNLPGFVAEGNARAEKLANPVWVAPQPDTLAQAMASHEFFHQNAHTLQKQFQLMPTEACDIVELCDDCHALAGPLPAGVNPRGLRALEIWQTDVTQIAEFGRLKYVHVTVDTFSSAMWASAHTGEKTRDVLAHWRQAFAILGIPSAVKADNGPAYASQKVWQFLQLWGVAYKFGIPHSPAGQAILECAHGLDKPHQPRAKVWVQNLVTKQWEGPYDLIASGRGYACVSTDTGVRWIPAKCVRPDLRPQRENLADRQAGDCVQSKSHQVDEPSSYDSDADDANDHSDGPSTSRS